MEPHRSSDSASRRQRAPREPQPTDRDWLEQSAFRYASRWESSSEAVRSLLERKIRERCERSGESPEPLLADVGDILRLLIERGYVDDRRFATETFDRLRRQGRSRAQIRARLAARGICAPLLDELLDRETPEAEHRAAWEFARRKRLGPYCADVEERRARRDRHLAALGRQGFELEVARQIVDAAAIPEPG
jgi:regulatory protein